MATIRKKEESGKRMVCLAQEFLAQWVMNGWTSRSVCTPWYVCVLQAKGSPSLLSVSQRGFQKWNVNTRETAVLLKNCKQTYNVQKCFWQDLHLPYKLWVRNSKTDMCNSPQLVNGSDRTQSSRPGFSPLHQPIEQACFLNTLAKAFHCSDPSHHNIYSNMIKERNEAVKERNSSHWLTQQLSKINLCCTASLKASNPYSVKASQIDGCLPFKVTNLY